MAVKIQLRGDTKANWLLTNPVISEREMVLETDTGKYKIGDGVKIYADLSYHGIDGKPSRITVDGFWDIYNPATDAYTKTEYKAVPSEVQVSVKTNNATTYVLTFVYVGGTFDTPNLRGANGSNGVGASVAVVTNTATEYILKFTSASGEVTTPNLKPQNYDDTAVKSALITLQNQINTLVSGDATSAIESFNEIIAFLANVEDTQTLSGIIAGINQSISNVQAAIPTKISQLQNDDHTVKDASYVHTDNNYSSEDKQKLKELLLDIPILSSAPNNYTTTYTDENNVLHPFRIGQMCRVSVSTFSSRAPSWSPDHDYDFYIMTQGWFDMEGNENTDPYNYAWWTKITWKSATQASSGLMSSEDKKQLDNAVVPTNVTVATTLTSLSIANYSIKVTLSAASALSFASTPEEGWECMIDIKNTGSSTITQPLPNGSGWQCEDASIAIAAGKIASISVRRVHSTYVVIAKGN